MNAKKLAIAALLFVSLAAASHENNAPEVIVIPGEGRVLVVEDDKRNVTCWIYADHGGIDCISNSELWPDEDFAAPKEAPNG